MGIRSDSGALWRLAYSSEREWQACILGDGVEWASMRHGTTLTNDNGKVCALSAYVVVVVVDWTSISKTNSIAAVVDFQSSNEI